MGVTVPTYAKYELSGLGPPFYRYRKSKQLCGQITAGMFEWLRRPQRSWLQVFDTYMLTFNSGPALSFTAGATWNMFIKFFV